MYSSTFIITYAVTVNENVPNFAQQYITKKNAEPIDLQYLTL